MICDLAETYHVFNYRELPAKLVATLVAGLRADSRTKMEINGAKAPTDTLIMAMVYDKLNQWIWLNSKQGRKGHNPPPSLVEKLVNNEKQSKVQAYDSGDEFDLAFKRITGG